MKKLVNESVESFLNEEMSYEEFTDSDVRGMCFDIASTVQSMLEGDDVNFEPISDEERENLENELGWDLEDLADSDNLEDTSPENVYDIYTVLVSHGYLNESLNEAKKKKWIQKAFKSIKKKGTEGKCTGEKFGSASCPPGSKQFNMAKKMKVPMTFTKKASSKNQNKMKQKKFEHQILTFDEYIKKLNENK